MSDYTPSAIQGDTADYPGAGALLQLGVPWLASAPSYTDLPPYWSPRRDWVLSQTIHRESMWGAVVGKVATKIAAHSYIIKDAEDSKRRIGASQELMKRADGGQGWVQFAMRIVQDLLTTDNGVIIRIRRAGEEVQTIRTKAARPVLPDLLGGRTDGPQYQEVQIRAGSGAGRITGLYHLDSLRCTRTGNLAYPVRYQPLQGPPQLLRWDQVLMYADMPSPRAELLGVGLCPASRAYHKIGTLAALEQMVHEYTTGTGAVKLVFVQGILEKTLRELIASGIDAQQAKGYVYYLGTILGAIPGDVPVQVKEVKLKELPHGFDPNRERTNAYLVYANAIGISVQEIEPLSGQGLGTGTQTLVLQEASQGIGLAAFLKWLEQTFADRVFPASTTLEFSSDTDMRDQEAKAKVASLRAGERATRIQSGEISPAMARQLAVDSGDIPPELVDQDATPGGTLADDQKPLRDIQASPQARALLLTEPTSPPSGQMPQQMIMTKTPPPDREAARALLEDADVQRRAALLVAEVRG